MQGYSTRELSSASLICTETQTECPCRPSMLTNSRDPRPAQQTDNGRVWSVRREFVFYAFVIMQKQPHDYHRQRLNITNTISQ